MEAPVIRQLFSSSPRDPRYHMLSYISHKFSQTPQPSTHEPRAALFLNRFTRTLPIMYATDGLADLLGISAAELSGRSFYFCIQENCLRDAVKCLESAKANDSIAYIRFWYRDPRENDEQDRDEPMMDGVSSGDEDEGGVHLQDRMDEDGSEVAVATGSSGSQSGQSNKYWDHRNAQNSPEHTGPGGLVPPSNTMDPNSRTSSGNSTDLDGNAPEAIFDQPNIGSSSASSISNSASGDESSQRWRRRRLSTPSVELEAVISCTSDGLVVVLRQARPAIPQISAMASQPTPQRYDSGLFASPWAVDPILPHASTHPHHEAPNPFPLDTAPARPTVPAVGAAGTGGPPMEDFMDTIRDIAVFAWALTGINGSIAAYSRGKPFGEAQPPNLPIWDPQSGAGMEYNRYNNNVQRYSLGNRSDSYYSSYGPGGLRPQEDTSWLRRTPQRQVWNGLLPRNQEAYGNGDQLPHQNGFPASSHNYHAQNSYA